MSLRLLCSRPDTGGFRRAPKLRKCQGGVRCDCSLGMRTARSRRGRTLLHTEPVMRGGPKLRRGPANCAFKGARTALERVLGRRGFDCAVSGESPVTRIRERTNVHGARERRSVMQRCVTHFRHYPGAFQAPRLPSGDAKDFPKLRRFALEAIMRVADRLGRRSRSWLAVTHALLGLALTPVIRCWRLRTVCARKPPGIQRGCPLLHLVEDGELRCKALRRAQQAGPRLAGENV